MRFAESHDLHEYRYLPDTLFGPGYTGGPILRSYGEWYYMFYITGDYETEFVWNVSRSRDLRHWEASAYNPIMRPEESDRRLAPGIVFPKEEQERLKTVRHINVSDMDFCDWQGHLTINYSWGDQKGTEFLALAEADVTEREFCEQYFS